MAQEINISKDLDDLLATRNFDVEIRDAQGPSDAENGKVFKFDWTSSSGTNYGTAVIVVGEENELLLFFGDNLGKGMENPQDKQEWFDFMGDLKQFSVRHNFHTFSPKNINQLKHTMAGIAAIKEGLFEGYYGTRKVSYMGEQTEARLVIKHNRMIGEDDKRYRYVESLFIETADGERFKLPFAKLSGGRAMLEHVKQGGRPYDIRGQHINEIVSEMAVLSRFNRASQQRVFEGITQELVETVHHYYSELRGNLQHISSGRGYKQYFESWTPADIGDETALVEDLKTMFIEQTLDARIEAALPTLAKIQQRGRDMKEAQIFENWINNLAEGTWALPDTPEQLNKLNELMSKELIVGPDATNATEQLYDLVGDDVLFDRLSELAAASDGKANIWDDTEVQARLQDLGIQLNSASVTDQQEPVAPEAAPVAPEAAPVAPEGVAESAELNTMLKYAGIPVAEGVLDDVRARMDARGNPVAAQPAAAAPVPARTPEFKVGDVVEYWTGIKTPQNPRRGTIISIDSKAPGMAEIMVRTSYGLEELLHTGNKSQTIRKVNSLSVIEPETQAAPATAAPVATAEAFDQLPRPDNWKPPVPNPRPRPAPQKQMEVGDIIGFTPQQHDATSSGKVFKAEVLEIGGRLGRSGVLLKLLNPEDIAANGGRDTMKISFWGAKIQNPYVEPAQQGVAESTELNSMLKYAGIPVAESRVLDEAGETIDHILNRFKHEVTQFEQGNDLDSDLYEALFDYYSDKGEMPYGVAKARTGDPYNWVSDKFAQHLGINEADVMSTFEVMSGFDAPVVESSCNMTAEGDFCPEHGLAECGGMYEMGTVAGGMAPVMGEGGQDPMDHRGAVTDSFYESTLARIKSLALLR